jgi:hypothetical protein
MEERVERHGASPIRKVVTALVVGFVVFVVLFPWGGGTSPFPPECYSMLGLYSVPCDVPIAFAAGAVMAGIAGLALWLNDGWVVRLGMALLAGFGMAVVLAPTSGAREWCFSLLSFRVACDGTRAIIAGALTTGLVGVVLLLLRSQPGGGRTAERLQG